MKTINIFGTPRILKPTYGIAVDASVINGNPGNGEFQGIDINTKKVLFEYKMPGITTNNVVEFLALVKGVQYLIEKDMIGQVYSDSQTALAWYRKKKHNCKMNRYYKTEESFVQMEIAAHIIPKQNHMKYVDMWVTKSFGENLADYGRK